VFENSAAGLSSLVEVRGQVYIVHFSVVGLRPSGLPPGWRREMGRTRGAAPTVGAGDASRRDKVRALQARKHGWGGCAVPRASSFGPPYGGLRTCPGLSHVSPLG
jgi:hypothetical protein